MCARSETNGREQAWRAVLKQQSGPPRGRGRGWRRGRQHTRRKAVVAPWQRGGFALAHWQRGGGQAQLGTASGDKELRGGFGDDIEAAVQAGSREAIFRQCYRREARQRARDGWGARAATGNSLRRRGAPRRRGDDLEAAVPTGSRASREAARWRRR